MAFVLEDRVIETANSPGQGDFELLGATGDNRTFVFGIGDGNTTRYLAIGAEGWEIGIGTVSAGSPDRLLRPGSVTKNSNGNTTPVDFGGVVTVACIASVEDVLWLDENGDLPARGGRDVGLAGDRWRSVWLSGTLTAAGGANVSNVRIGDSNPNRIHRNNTFGSLVIAGGNSGTDGANVLMRGSSDGSSGELRSGTDRRLRWDPSGVTVDVPVTVASVSFPAIVIERLGFSVNAVVEYKTTAGSLYGGAATQNVFAVGGSASLNDETNRWLSVTSSGTRTRGPGGLLPVANVYQGDDIDATNLPIGHPVLVVNVPATARNRSEVIRLHANISRYTVGGEGTPLSGTFMARGRVDGTTDYLFVRVL